MHGWNTFTSHLRRRFGQRVQKIPLDAGSSCPNRDGVLSRAGCTFCNAVGSGSGMGLSGMDLPAQWDHWRAHFHASGRATLFIAYLQSFSNTYGSISRFSTLLDVLRDLPDMAGISVGTRPDCIDAEKAVMLAALPCPEKWLELGVQTLHDATLLRINRGHNAAASEAAIKLVATAGVQVCAHLMLGLPGESPDDVLETIRRINDLPVHGVKFHNVYVCSNTALEHEFRTGTYTPLAEEAYIELIIEALHRLRPDIIIHRVVADPAPGELVAPLWATKKADLLRAIEHGYHKKTLERC